MTTAPLATIRLARSLVRACRALSILTIAFTIFGLGAGCGGTGTQSSTLLSIAVTPITPTIAQGTTLQLTATGTYTDGTTKNVSAEVTWASGTPATATVTTAGLARGVAVGSTVITATSGTIVGKTTLTVKEPTPTRLLSITVTPALPSIAKGSTQQFVATGAFDDGSSKDLSATATWASATTTTATISATGLAAGLASGTTTISATSDGITGATTLTVTEAKLVSIAVTPDLPSIAKGTTKQFVATGTFDDNSVQDLSATVTWTSSTTATATISNTGLATAVAAGTTTISAASGTIAGGTTLTVTPANLVSIAVTPATPTIAKGTKQSFVATGTFNDGTTQDLSTMVTWASATETIATISNEAGSTGKATGVAEGTTVISAKSGTITGSVTLTVSAATLVSIAVTPATPTIAKGTKQQFVATGTFTDATTQDLSATVTWGSSVPATVSISSAAGSQGLAVGQAVGDSVISATSGTITGSTTLTVSTATLVSIAVTPPAPAIAKGTKLSLVAIGTFTDATTQDLTATVAWASATEATATVSNAAGSKGQASGNAAGTTVVSATSGTITGNVTLTVTAAVLASIAVTPATPAIARGTQQQFVATGKFTDNTTQDLSATVTWGSSAPATVSISNAAGSKGLALGLLVGDSVISASSVTGGATITGSTTLTVSPGALVSIAVTPAAPTIAKGTQQQFVATGRFTDNTTQDLSATVTWGSSAPATVSISNALGSKGLAVGQLVGDSVISATSGTISGSTTLSVSTAALVSIALTPPTPTIAKGTKQQFAATGTFTDNTTQDLSATVTWASATEATATISNAPDSKGLASGIAAGTTLISATSGTITGSLTLTVTAAQLVSIAVTPPAPTIAKGTNQQFVATGTFTDDTTQDLSATVTWGSSAPATVSISNAAGSKGLAVGQLVGDSVISATSGTGAETITGSTTLTVSPGELVSIAVTPATPAIAKGTQQRFVAVGTFTDSTTQDLSATVSWASATEATATISNAAGSKGIANGVAPGTTVISATSGTITGSVTLTVTAAKLVSIEVTPATPTIARGTKLQFSAIGTFSDSTTQNLSNTVAWSSGTVATATISNAAGSIGLASGVAPGTTLISATSGAIAGSVTLTVTPATLVSIALTPNPATMAKGTKLQFTATGFFNDATTQNVTLTATWTSGTPAAAIISNAAGSIGEATGLTQGTTIISARIGNVTGTISLAVSAAVLTSIAVTPASPTLPKGAKLKLVATGTFSDGTTSDLSASAATTWTSGTEATATISNAADSKGLASALAEGTTVISAKNGTITGSTTLTVTQATLTSIAIEPAAPTIAKGTNQQFVATGTFTDNTTQDLSATVTWGSSAAAVASISNAAGSKGLAVGLLAGQSVISATSVTPGGTISASTILTVSPGKLVSITVTPATPIIAKGTKQQLAATGTYDDGTTQSLTAAVTWASETEATAVVSNAAGSKGLASGIAAGTTVVSATSEGVTGKITLTVTGAKLLSIVITPSNMPTIAKGTTQQFVAIGFFDDTTTQDLSATVTWGSSLPATATISNAVDSPGLATGKAVGTTTISATLGTVTGSVPLAVTAATLTSIAVTPSAPTIAKGTKQQMVATGTYTDASTQVLTTLVTWSSATQTTATISNAMATRGLATSVAEGSTQISASFQGVTGATTLTVTGTALMSIAVTPANPTLAKGTTLQLVATGTFSDGSTQILTTAVTWSSTVETRAAVSNAAGSNGLVSGLDLGATTISARSGTITGSITLTVTAATLVSIAISSPTLTVAKNATVLFTATGTFSDGSTQTLTTTVTWTSGTPAIATISNAMATRGRATGVAAGMTVITATSTANNTIKGQATLTVTT